MEKTINISDSDIRTTLDEFLEEDEKKKEKKSIWNISTITGIILVLISAAFVGHSIGQAIGFTGLSFVTGIVSLAPYFGGVLLGLILISTFVKSREKKQISYEEKKQVNQTYDKLDEFLYTSKGSKAKAKAKKDSKLSSRLESVHRLTKSRTDKKISGVCGGLAKYLGINSTIVRIIFVAAMLLGYGSFLLVYIAMAIVMPKEPIEEMDDFKFLR
jgi:phage shock protein PspC (stress-responsive transcriptional regulator)